MKPEVEHIAITRQDGGIAIMQFVTRGILNEDGAIFEREATDDAVNAEIAKARIPAVSWRRIDPAELPTDRTFRDAWTDAGRVTVDMAKARGIHRDRLRALRAPKLAALDIAYQRADEMGDSTAKKSVATQKQALRDITKDSAIDSAATPEELAAVIPQALTSA